MPKQAQRGVEMASRAVHDSRTDHHRLAKSFDEAEGALNEELGCIHMLIAKTAAATSAISVGWGDRGDNEAKYLQDALTLMNHMFKEEVQEDYELVLGDKGP